MKLVSFTALALATGQCVLALPFPPEYYASNHLQLRDAHESATTFEPLHARAKLGELLKQGSGGSRPGHSSGSRPGHSGGSRPARLSGSRPSSPRPSTVGTHRSGRRPGRSSRPNSGHVSQPLSEKEQEHERKAKYDADTLALKKEDFAEAKKHNRLTRKIATAAVGATAAGAAVLLGLGVNNAIETHNLNQFNQQHGRRRRAINDDSDVAPALAARAKGFRVGRVKVRPNYNNHNNANHITPNSGGSHRFSHASLEPSLSHKERQRKAQHDAEALELDRNKLAETKSHNSRNRKIAAAAVIAAGSVAVVNLGLGINTAIETHQKNQYDEQKALAAQKRRAVIADDEYELYFVQ